MTLNFANRLTVCAVLAILASRVTVRGDDPLPSWNDGATKTAITGFVSRVTTKCSADYVPPEERIAVFDNDGTLWSEKPVYFQLLFAIDGEYSANSF